MNLVSRVLKPAGATVWGRAALALSMAGLMVVAGGPVRTADAQTPPRDIVDTAAGAGQFNTLVTAVQAAGLVDTLKGPGPFTVFAPTDAAFAKLPAATLNGLLADPARLRAVLTYHVVAGRVAAADVVRLQSAATVQGEPVRIAVSGSTVRLNGSSTVVQTDIAASNGVIHVIDTVLLPPSIATLPQTGAGTNLGLWAAAAAGVVLLTGLGLRLRPALRPVR